ncbi:DUF6397 family protein [Streptomyces coffeae]|uniref:DNA-binding protein n=1 Tax=Streptomyces coffeae TaxID=621382 RepID=A0ABS1NJS2_9ACTN|nr:DUF6397 family protein [Streptomyces coffeae]MBL1100356.1 hypothetical protein [Streptomyces coffeae]
MTVQMYVGLKERQGSWGPAGPEPGSPEGEPRSSGEGEGVAFGAAARALGLRPRELELAVQLGEVHTVGTGARPRVAHAELARLTTAEGFPEALAARLRVVGTADGADLLGISPGRLTRLARGGFFAPVRFYVNRYRVVVWIYLAADLTELAARRPELLSGRTPPGLSAALAAGEDRRAESWRRRRIEQLLARTEEPWARAAVLASALAPDDLAVVVGDPHERSQLRELRPALIRVRPDSGPVREVIDRTVTADDPREIRRYGAALTEALRDVRASLPAPCPEAEEPPQRGGRHRSPDRPRGLWRRLTGRR